MAGLLLTGVTLTAWCAWHQRLVAFCMDARPLAALLAMAQESRLDCAVAGTRCLWIFITVRRVNRSSGSGRPYCALRVAAVTSERTHHCCSSPWTPAFWHLDTGQSSRHLLYPWSYNWLHRSAVVLRPIHNAAAEAATPHWASQPA